MPIEYYGRFTALYKYKQNIVCFVFAKNNFVFIITDTNG